MSFDLNCHMQSAKAAAWTALTQATQDAYNRYESLPTIPSIECADGFKISVQASRSHYCIPRNNLGPWVEVECGFPGGEVPTLAEWKDGDGEDTKSVFGWVPVYEVEYLIAKHGGVK